MSRRSAPRPAHPTGAWSAASLNLAPADWVLLVFVGTALLLGGGGSPTPMPEMLLEWTALLALVAALWLAPDRPWPRPALIAASAMLLLPLVQLIPLPPSLWQSLPGREVEVAALDLVGEGQRWMPWSISPARTLASLLALLPPLAALVLTARASRKGRTAGLLVIVAAGLLAVAFGAAQLAAGPESPLRLYRVAHTENLTGFHANRNAAADGLIVALLALAALFWARKPHPRSEVSAVSGLAAVAALTLVSGTFLTSSRAGIALLLVVLAGLGAVAFWRGRKNRRRFRRRGTGLLVAIAAAITAVAGLAVWALSASSVASQIAARFGNVRDDPRPELWTDTLHAIGLSWPWGTGLGTFAPAFIAAERLEVVDSSRPNRAHNDFLELALEAGLPGLILFAALAGWLAIRLARRLRASNPGEERAHLWFAGASLAVFAAHSVVDYPMRSMALATVAGFAAGIVFGRGRVSVGTAGGRRETGTE